MSLDKTKTDVYRRELDLDRYDVYEALPSRYDTDYPNLVNFLQEYYKTLELEGNPAQQINDLLLSRDVTQVKEEFLTFISKELLLGAPYFESFNDKRSALQYSNLLYRSKGTSFSIEQFFRLFYGLDVNVRYGKDEVFYVGDPETEEIIYEGGQNAGGVFKFNYQGGEKIISAQNDDDEFIDLTQDEHYVIDFSTQTIQLLSGKLDTNGDLVVAQEGDTALTNMATNGYLDTDKQIKIITKRGRSTLIGADVQDKRLTNDEFYQLFALLVETPVSVKIWRDAYKTFVHPAGMWFGGQVQIESVFDLNLGGQPTFIEPPPPVLAHSSAQLFKRQGAGLFTSSITELSLDSDGYVQRTRVNDQYLSGVNLGDTTLTIEQWNAQYISIERADDINGRTLDTTYGDLSNTFNTLDEDHWLLKDSDGSGTHLLGRKLPAPYWPDDSDGLP
jgi:hypothetical protein